MNDLSLDLAASMLGVCKQTLRRWDESGKLVAQRGENGYRTYQMEEILKHIPDQRARPFLKWAGGKTHLLPELLKNAPWDFNTYIEPFLGGGALFFALAPKQAKLNDTNAELINTYVQIRDQPNGIIEQLYWHEKKHSRKHYYETRDKNPRRMNSLNRAARFIYLNKTCFNGLHRVNKEGKFNVPIGSYKKPTIVDEKNIYACSRALQNAELFAMDYKEFLEQHCGTGDFVYLDPPYIPVSEYSDFDRYAQDKFRVGEHQSLSLIYRQIVNNGAFAMLSNSAVELSRRLYSEFKTETVKASRNINNSGTGRGKIEEILVLPQRRSEAGFPSTRFMGSKSALLPHLNQFLKVKNPGTVLDAFSGSGVVSYHLKRLGYKVIANDFLRYSSVVTKALVENSCVTLTGADLDMLLKKNRRAPKFVQKTFAGLYFEDDDNRFIDNATFNIRMLDCEFKKSIALAALSRACLKRRPRGIFTYVGFKYDDGRKDLSYSLQEHFLFSVDEINKAVFSNGRENKALNQCALSLQGMDPDVVYLDPPYFSNHSDNDYVRRYHFIEGLCRNWEDVEIQHGTKTKKFRKFVSPFNTKEGTYRAFEELFHRYKKSKLLISYSSNCFPTKEEIILMLKKQGKSVSLTEIDYKYSFGTQSHKVGNNNNDVSEYLFFAE